MPPLEIIDEFFIDLTVTNVVGPLNSRQPGTTEIPLRAGAADNVELAAQFSPSARVYVKRAWLKLKQDGTIASGKIIRVRIEGDTSGSPSGTVVGTSETVDAEDVPSEFGWIKFNFPTLVCLQKSTVYHLILYGDYTASAVNRIFWRSVTVASGGIQEIKDAAWADISTESFEVYTESLDDDQGSFSEAAVYTPSGGTATDIPVIFDAPGTPVRSGDAVFETTAPSVTTRSEDVSDATNDATIVIRGVTYKVVNVMPDGQGITRLELSTQ